MRTLIGAAFAALVMSQPALAIGERYGAIALSESGPVAGAIYDALAASRAESAAMSRCEASDCVIVMELRNMCGAVAVNDENFRTWYEHPIQRAAEDRALERCEDRGGKCRILESGCVADVPSRR